MALTSADGQAPWSWSHVRIRRVLHDRNAGLQRERAVVCPDQEQSTDVATSPLPCRTSTISTPRYTAAPPGRRARSQLPARLDLVAAGFDPKVNPVLFAARRRQLRHRTQRFATRPAPPPCSKWTKLAVSSGYALVPGPDGKGRVPLGQQLVDGTPELYIASGPAPWTLGAPIQSDTSQGAPALAYDASGHPHVAYYGSKGVMYGTTNGTTWTWETVATGTIPLGLAMALDSHGTPHVAYVVGTELEHMRPKERRHYRHERNAVRLTVEITAIGARPSGYKWQSTRREIPMWVLAQGDAGPCAAGVCAVASGSLAAGHARRHGRGVWLRTIDNTDSPCVTHSGDYGLQNDCLMSGSFDHRHTSEQQRRCSPRATAAEPLRVPTAPIPKARRQADHPTNLEPDEHGLAATSAPVPFAQFTVRPLRADHRRLGFDGGRLARRIPSRLSWERRPQRIARLHESDQSCRTT